MVANRSARGNVNLVITNVPGPQFPMYLAGAEMVETYPIPPLQQGFSMAVGVTSYDGAVYYGISADFDALPDVEVLGQCVPRRSRRARRQRQREPAACPARAQARKGPVSQGETGHADRYVRLGWEPPISRTRP